jgi:hypothetical protein
MDAVPDVIDAPDASSCDAAEMCGGRCVDLRSDVRNCGRCGAICASNEVCTDGVCGIACPSGQSACGSVCVDLQSDPAHCGACGTRCPSGRPCEGGFCSPVCESGFTACRGMCVDTRVDTNHCGACGRACVAGLICVAGACVCPAGLTDCGGTCADLSRNNFHCGACGNACTGGLVCSGSRCVTACSPIETRCAGVCTNTSSDAANCGACGMACATGQLCTRGVCACPAGQSLCGGACRDVSADVLNCGACGNACPSAPGGTATCAGGRCGLTCFTGVADCNRDPSDGCETDLSRSVQHCGACGNACTAPPHGSSLCFASRCEVLCDVGYALMGGACVAVGVPRLLSPPSGAVATVRQPRLRWELPPGADTVVIDLCADRACTTMITSMTVTGTSAAPGADLPVGPVFWRARAAGTMDTSATWEFFVQARGAGPNTHYGVVTDVNGDGTGDALVASSAGVQVFHGGATGLDTSAAATLTVTGAGTSYVPVAAGDVNGDGFVDVAVGTPDSGRVQVYLGSAAGLGTTPAVTLAAPAGAMRFGRALAGLGDVDRDGYADLLVGTEGSNTAYLYAGGAAGPRAMPALTLAGPAGVACFGCTVAGAGDVNGDEFDDVVVGACSPGRGPCAEQAFVHLGSATGLRATAAATLMAPAGATRFAAALAGAGDVNDDGYADVVVGAPGSDRALLYRGSASGLVLPPTTLAGAAGSGAGASVASAGDVNGDAFDDVVVGAPSGDAALLFRGGLGGIDATAAATLTGSVGSRFGAQVAGGRNVNRDGYADVLVGAPAGNQVYVFHGNATGLAIMPATTLSGPTGAMGFGTYLACGAPRTPRPLRGS